MGSQIQKRADQLEYEGDEYEKNPVLRAIVDAPMTFGFSPAPAFEVDDIE